MAFRWLARVKPRLASFVRTICERTTVHTHRQSWHRSCTSGGYRLSSVRGFSIGFEARRSRPREVDMTQTLAGEKVTSLPKRDATVPVRRTVPRNTAVQTRKPESPDSQPPSSARWFDEPVTGMSGSLRFVLIVAVLITLTFIAVAWLCSRPPYRSIDYYLRSPIVVQRQVPGPQLPALPVPTPVRNP
jgi:hypothetical protein